MWILLQLAGGLTLLYFGAIWLVRGGAGLALRTGLTPLVVGCTIIAMGTSSPELVVSLRAAMAHDSAIALGNVIGSNIANLALVIGVAAIIRPIHVEHAVVRREVPLLLLTTGLLVVMLLDRRLGRLEGGLLIVGLLAYIAQSIRAGRVDTEMDAIRTAPPQSLGRQWLLLGLGLALLLPGAHWFLQGAVTLAQRMGLSPLVIGLTVVAVGTSLPELATSMAAAAKGESDLAIGNAFGSNIWNILLILGVTAFFFEIDASSLSRVDLGVMSLFAVVMYPVARTGFVISRREGIALLAGYGAYLTILVLREHA